MGGRLLKTQQKSEAGLEERPSKQKRVIMLRTKSKEDEFTQTRSNR